MKPVEIYTSPLCGFCHAAKRLLTQKGVSFREFDVLSDPARKPEMIKRANGGRTVPQIFVGDTHVGGCDDLYALERAGKLDGALGGLMQTALVQLTSGDDPEANLVETQRWIDAAADQGSEFVLTPEVTNCVSASRTRQNEVLATEDADKTLAALRAQAKARGLWLLIGSLALRTDDPDGRFANRSFLIDPDGAVVARYDKIHMFDVAVSETETYRESAGYRPGETAVVADMPSWRLGLTICYDVRFPYLYRALADAGATVFDRAIRLFARHRCGTLARLAPGPGDRNRGLCPRAGPNRCPSGNPGPAASHVWAFPDCLAVGRRSGRWRDRARPCDQRSGYRRGRRRAPENSVAHPYPFLYRPVTRR